MIYRISHVIAFDINISLIVSFHTPANSNSNYSDSVSKMNWFAVNGVRKYLKSTLCQYYIDTRFTIDDDSIFNSIYYQLDMGCSTYLLASILCVLCYDACHASSMPVYKIPLLQLLYLLSLSLKHTLSIESHRDCDTNHVHLR